MHSTHIKSSVGRRAQRARWINMALYLHVAKDNRILGDAFYHYYNITENVLHCDWLKAGTFIDNFQFSRRCKLIQGLFLIFVVHNEREVVSKARATNDLHELLLTVKLSILSNRPFPSLLVPLFSL